MIGIYKISSPSGRVYIGQSWDINNRFRQYRQVKRICKQKALYSSFMKYGLSSHVFSIIIELDNPTQEELDNLEIKYIQEYRDNGFRMMNIKEGGKGGKHSLQTIKAMTGRKLTQKHKESISKGRKGNKNNNLVSGKMILNNSTGQIYSSISECAKLLGSTPSNICSMLKGRRAKKHNLSYYGQEKTSRAKDAQI